MSPSGGVTTVVLQPITWSPVNSARSSARAKHRWFEVCPGVWTASKVHPGPLTIVAVGQRAPSGSKPRSIDSSSCLALDRLDRPPAAGP